jgi:superfamily II DNA or RNA helicase
MSCKKEWGSCMKYFSNNYLAMQYPLANEESEALGLRNAQIGAIHALGAYYTTKREPVLISMPTGTGKTAVIMMAPYLLRANKVLVITPTVLVRSQISENFGELQVLKNIGVFENNVKAPNVYEMKHRYSEEQKRAIQDANVVITTPNCALPLSENLDVKSLFDLIIIDEAHHEPAKTWRTVLNNMPETKQILFTATPFRRDKKEIKANHIYNYPLSQAYRDGVFGEVKYIPVELKNEENKDIALAKKGEEIFLRDKASNLEHALMVRCKSKKDAERLFDLYTKETSLKLKVVDSSRSRKEVLGIIDNLKEQKIDGVLCVDMMAEGFDFPNLKIAVIHHPHRSLATTLQFIGRFARTNKEKKIGDATFIAVNDEEFSIENKKLFSSDSIWQDIIIDLSEEKINQDIEEQKYLKGYDNQLILTNNQEFSLHSIYTNFHARIYHANSFNLYTDFPELGMKVENIMINPDDETIAVVASSKQLPRWSTNDGVYFDFEYNTFIIHYQKKNKLLFINSHIKSESSYDAIAIAYCGEDNYEKITMSNIHRVLSGVQNHEIFNSGLANRLSEGESYKISSGSDVSKAIDSDSGKMYSPGHVFCKAEEADTQITIGYSSGSKIWSSQYGNIREMVKWFDLNGDKISNKQAVVKTNTNYDLIPMPSELEKFPNDIFMWDFNQQSYVNPHYLLSVDGQKELGTILDIDISIESVTSSEIHLRVDTINTKYTLIRSINGKFTSSIEDELLISVGRQSLPLSMYLNEFPLSFYTSSLGLIVGNEISKYDYDLPAFNSNKIINIDWAKYNTNLSMEFKSTAYTGNENSIQDTVGEILMSDDAFNYVIFDHGSGEIADYLSISVLDNEIIVSLYHAKGKSSVQLNSSVGDVYEVLGQSIKSLIWLKNKGTLLTKLRNRQKSGHGIFIKGDIDLLDKDLKKNIPIRGRVVACQPSLTNRIALPEKIGEVLSATSMKIKNSAVANEFIVWGS